MRLSFFFFVGGQCTVLRPNEACDGSSFSSTTYKLIDLRSSTHQAFFVFPIAHFLR